MALRTVTVYRPANRVDRPGDNERIGVPRSPTETKITTPTSPPMNVISTTPNVLSISKRLAFLDDSPLIPFAAVWDIVQPPSRSPSLASRSYWFQGPNSDTVPAKFDKEALAFGRLSWY
jgi:hypothetical protein